MSVTFVSFAFWEGFIFHPIEGMLDRDGGVERARTRFGCHLVTGRVASI